MIVPYHGASDATQLQSVLLGCYLACQALGNIGGLGRVELSQGLPVLILGVEIRTCAGQIYPYVTKKLRVPGGYQLVEVQVPQSIPLLWQPLLQESTTLLGACLLLGFNLPQFELCWLD